MKTVRLISLMARIALIVTMGLGLFYWIALLFSWSWLLVLLVQIDFPNIHEVFGTIGAIGLLILGGITVWTHRNRLLGVGGIGYALMLPAFGMTQTLILTGNLHWLIRIAHLLVGIGAMALVQAMEKRYRLRRQTVSGETSPQTTTFQATR